MAIQSCPPDEAAIDSLARQIDRLLPRLQRYALRLTRNAAAADDLVQETLVRGIANIHRWQQGTDLRAWLFTILHNQFVSGIRRATREVVKVDQACAGAALVSPGRQIAVLELRDLERALARLPVEQRVVVLLVGYEGMEYETIASLLALPLGTVRSRLSRGRTRLRELTCSADSRRKRAGRAPSREAA
ncbi:MAG: sigma-70 family RNA polymerase sigma factor [Stellaceae bacterium]